MKKVSKDEEKAFNDAMRIILEAFDLVDKQVGIHFQKKRAEVSHGLATRCHKRFDVDTKCSNDTRIPTRIDSETIRATSA